MIVAPIRKPPSGRLPPNGLRRAVHCTVEDNAHQPRRMKGDEAEIEEHSLPDQIAADRYLATKTALDVQTPGLRFDTLKPPGAP